MKTSVCLSPSKIQTVSPEERNWNLFIFLNLSCYCFAVTSLKFPNAEAVEESAKDFRGVHIQSGRLILFFFFSLLNFQLLWQSWTVSFDTSSQQNCGFLLEFQPSPIALARSAFREKSHIIIYSIMAPSFWGSNPSESCFIYSSKFISVIYERMSLRLTYFILLCASLLCFTDTVFFIHWRSVATLHQASPLVPFFQQHLFSSCLCHILVILTVCQTLPLLLYLLWW